MAKFIYKGRTFEGIEIEGELEARDDFDLAKILRERGIILTFFKEKKEKIKRSLSIPLTQKIFFTRNLKVMIGSGISLPKAIDVLAGQVQHKTFKKVLFEIRDRIIRGEQFSETLKSYPGIFSEIYQSMIKVGEETGKLEEVLERLAFQMETEHQLKSEVKGAMYYPIVVILAMIGIGILMMMVVIPKLSMVFKELGATLPLTTRLIVSMGEFMTKKWYFVLLLFGGIFFLFRFFLKSKKGKRILDKILLRIPVLSRLIIGTNLTDMCRNLSTLISAGVPLPQAIEITSRTLGNYYFQKELKEGIEIVSRGGKLSEHLQKSKIYPPILSQMLMVGEETGETAEILARLSNFYEEETLRLAKNLSTILEPILLLLVGGAVGLFAISMLQPIYSLMQSLSK